MAPNDLLLKPPTSLQGVMDEGRYYALSVDFAEHVPDVVWPLSNQTFSQMRNDPAVAAVLSAVMLPIRRATWAVDPTGCRDQVAQMVADDLGLPVLGTNAPTAARTRGVSWPEHLRGALMYLVYGHSAWEMLADTSSGQARLVGLYERVQHTISFIHSTPNGDFGGISQFYHPDREEAPEIAPEAMVFYSHNREGSAWHGRSLLRPMYAPFLLKREMQRVLATSSSRFGMGVPTVEWAAGTNPTPGQMQQAVQAASASRVGEQSGLVLPPGAQLVLKGLSGGTPDTLAFIKWLDQQLSKSVLAQFMDLGGSSSSHGSFALGQSFVDLFILSIAAVAEELADQVTRQAAARVVEWNFGRDEPVPAVRVTDIGTKHEITADALLQLMQAGAITADPALEEYVRGTYQLPDRSIPWVPPAPKGGVGVPAAVSSADAAPVAASTPVVAARGRRPRGKTVAAGQTALPIAAAADGQQADGQPTPDQQPTQDQQQHRAAWLAAVAALMSAWPGLSAPMVAALAEAAELAIEAGDVAALGALSVPANVQAALAADIGDAMRSLADVSAGHVVAEAKTQGRTVVAPADAGTAAVDQVAEVTAGLIAAGYASAAARKALQVGADGTRDAVTTTLTDMGTAGSGMVADNIRAALSAAQNAGRAAVFRAYPPSRLIAQEHEDQAVCAPCKDIDQRVWVDVEEALAAYPVIGYVDCLGGTRCRGRLHPIWD